ncbi:MAG: glycerol-3-phosphate acyltransferase [Gaiellaceae bacterium]
MHLRLPRLLFAAASGYLLGTVPSADIASRVTKGGVVDLRSSGSRNPGGVNALRLLGNTPGRAVIVADVGKGYAACACGRLAGGDLGAHVAGVAAVVGHCYPVWTRFQGGKGVATSFGQCLYTFPAFAPVQLAVAVAATRIPRVQQRALVSAGAASAAWLTASVLWWKRGLSNSWGPSPTVALPLATAATVLVVGSAFARALRRRDPDDLTSSR